jgi:hypothetical protein
MELGGAGLLCIFAVLFRLQRECHDDIEECGRQQLIVLGRPAVPILIAVLRNDTFRRNIISSLLAFAQHCRSAFPSSQGLLRSQTRAITAYQTIHQEPAKRS